MYYRCSSLMVGLLLLSITAICQVVTLDQLDRKAQKNYSKALKCLKKGHKDKAIKGIETVVAANPNFEVGLKKLSALYLDEGLNDKAYGSLSQLMNLSENLNPKVVMSYAEVAEAEGDYDAAISAMSKGLGNSSISEIVRKKMHRRKAELEFRKMAYANPRDIQPVRLPNSVNTEAMEYHPSFNADGSLLFYVKATDEGRNEDLYYARAEGDSLSMGQPIRELNTIGQEGAFSLSQDGRVLIFTGCELPNSVGGCDLYISFKKDNHWTEPKNMGQSINSRWWDSTPTLSPDNRTLYFSSRRPGGHGGSDIWMAQLNTHNRWGTPINLGPEINTEGNEETPFIHADKKTLYFISDTHLGLGSYDIFVSRLGEDEKWPAPTNLGYPINTSEREGGLFINLSGQRAYYSSKLGESKADGGDLYYFDLPIQLRPDLVTYVKVEVRDAVTKRPMIAEVSLMDLLSGEQVIALGTDDKGKMLTTIKLGEYALNVSQQDYLFYSENIDVSTTTSMEDPFSFIVYLEPIPKKDAPAVVEAEAPKIILKNIFFETGSAELLSKSEGEITKLVNLLNDNPSLKIKILGHTDNVGSESANLKLSAERAKAVYDKLLARSIDRNRLQYEGKGESLPIAENETEEGRSINRRTEFFIIK